MRTLRQESFAKAELRMVRFGKRALHEQEKRSGMPNWAWKWMKRDRGRRFGHGGGLAGI